MDGWISGGCVGRHTSSSLHAATEPRVAHASSAMWRHCRPNLARAVSSQPMLEAARLTTCVWPPTELVLQTVWAKVFGNANTQTKLLFKDRLKIRSTPCFIVFKNGEVRVSYLAHLSPVICARCE